MMEDGIPYLQIRASLGELGRDLTEDCFTRWKRGGHQDYLREQRLIQLCRARADRVLELIRQPGQINGFLAIQHLASAQICEAAAELGGDILRQALQANPLNYFRMLNSFSRLSTGGLKCQRHLDDQAERLARLRQTKKTARKKGISPKSVKEMEDKLHLM
jgi:hypothetical protein